MERKKLVAIITGVISVLLGLVYLILVQLLDYRGTMIPAPVTTDISVLISSTNSKFFLMHLLSC